MESSNLQMSNVPRYLQNEGQNNKYQGCPAFMSDGRAFTDHRTANSREQENQANIIYFNGKFFWME